MKVESKYYEKKNEHVECTMCPHNCKIMPDKLGICRGRKHENGKLWAINYGRTTSIALDPIEKKPLYHFYPGKQILSIACNSCNMRCPFCQNWEISQTDVSTEYIAPDVLVKIFKEHPSIGVAYTYTEPLMWFEYLVDAGALIRNEGGKNVLVTNGLINEQPLTELLPLIDAMNIDLKTMKSDVYKKTLHGDLDTIKRTIELAHERCHIEITNLIVTGLNDKEKDIDAIIDYVASIDKNIPLHFSRYYPNYKYTKPPTPMKTIDYAYQRAREKLNYVYVGNVPAEDGAHTYCPQCGNLLVERLYFRAAMKGLKNHTCQKCGKEIHIVL
ncbi:MAG: AmmeMemoRadiSam system radical SAM enzyme [candidate division WOR-3 bacterium]|nr:MAG: AmmeMemoRadiSam system radical SAM enzyme [candidate division WOR-3 bacterium]